MMCAHPKRGRRFCFKLFFDCEGCLARRNARAVADTKNVRIDRKGFCPECAVHDDIGRLAANPGQSFQRVPICGHFAAVIFDEHFRQGDDVLCLRIEQTDGLDVLLQTCFAEFKHLGRCCDFVEQHPCGLVDTDIR